MESIEYYINKFIIMKKKYSINNRFNLLIIILLNFSFGFSQTTYTVTSTSKDGPGSLLEAIDFANANPGLDIIEFTPDLQVNAATPTINPSKLSMIHITESVIIDGKGGALIGEQIWVNAQGVVNPGSNCPLDAGYLIMAQMPKFIEVGILGHDNSGVDVIVKNLTIEQFNKVAEVRENASLTFEYFIAKDTWTTYQCLNTELIGIDEGASLTITDSKFLNSETWATPGGGSAIASINAGDLTIERSEFDKLSYGEQFAIAWNGETGSKVNIVSSRFKRSGGIFISGESETNIVNSIWVNTYVQTPDFGDRIINNSSRDMNIIASSIMWNSNDCNVPCQNSNLNNLIERRESGIINFIQTAVGFNFLADAGLPSLMTLGDLGTNGFTADQYTWIQPTLVQDAIALKTITNQPSLLTDLPAFNSPIVFTPSLDLDVEMVTPTFPGELIDIIPNGSPLLSPISGANINLDVVGNPRVDNNGERDIGALQLGLAPLLALVSTSDGAVELSWNEPLHHNGLSIVRYEVSYKDQGSSPTIESINIPNLTKTIIGLMNGIEYEFKIRAIYDDSGTEIIGPYSNIVLATPYGSFATPAIDALSGDEEVTLTWSLPDLGGRLFESYIILWRVDSTTDYTGGTTVLDANQTSTIITGLVNNATYEFSLVVKASSEFSSYVFTTSTPSSAFGIDDFDCIKGKFTYYPNPVEDYLFFNFNENFEVKLFAINGALLISSKNKKTINVAGLSSGTYILQIQVGSKICSGKILKK